MQELAFSIFSATFAPIRYITDACVLSGENTKGPELSAQRIRNLLFVENRNSSARLDFISHFSLSVVTNRAIPPDQELYVDQYTI